MNILIFIISPIVFYPVPETIFCIFLTLYKTDNLKLKIALLTILRPIVFTLVLGYIFPSMFEKNPIWLVGFLAAVMARDMIFGNQKYLSKLTKHGDNVSIEFINTF